RQADEPLTERSPLVPIVGHTVGWHRHANLMEDDFRLPCDLVTLLADDRDLPGVWNEQLPELLELGSCGVTAREDAEVDPDLEACRLLLYHEGDDMLDLHSRSYNRPGPDLTLSRLPAETPQCNRHSKRPPAGQNGHGRRLVPELLPVEVDRVDGVQEVLERAGVADRAAGARVV